MSSWPSVNIDFITIKFKFLELSSSEFPPLCHVDKSCNSGNNVEGKERPVEVAAGLVFVFLSIYLAFSLINIETMNGAPPQPDQRSLPTATQLYCPNFPLCPLYQMVGLLWVFLSELDDGLCQGPSQLSQWLWLKTPGASLLGHFPPHPSLCTMITVPEVPAVQVFLLQGG